MKISDVTLGALTALAVIFGTVLLVARVSSFKKAHMMPPCHPPTMRLTPIVRLHNADGEFFCTGVIINPKQALTAAHCVDDLTLHKRVISVRADDAVDVCVTAGVSQAETRSDQAILEGDFKDFDSMAIVTNAQEDLMALLDESRPLMSCGYPWGGPRFCSSVIGRSFYQSGILSKGFLFPGMSGGPVIDLTSGKVVALNFSVLGANIIISPLINIFDNLQVPQYEGEGQ